MFRREHRCNKLAGARVFTRPFENRCSETGAPVRSRPLGPRRRSQADFRFGAKSRPCCLPGKVQRWARSRTHALQKSSERNIIVSTRSTVQWFSVTAAGVRFGCVLADAGYGLSAPFRQGLTARNLAWAVGIPRHLKVYPVDVRLIWPVAKRGRPRRRYIPDILSMPAEDMLADAKWQMVSWRTGTKGKLKACFAAVRIRTADGPPQRIKDKGQQHLPGDEAWLIGELRASGEKKYYLANLPAATDLRTLAATIKARWICEQAHQQLKEELGLDHFEGRSWQGLHRHALMTMLAFAFLQFRRLKRAMRGKKNQRTAASTKPAGRPSRHRGAHRPTATAAMPPLPKTDLREHAA
jgi:SRSO17 transposase